MGTRICPHCGYSNSEQARFCSNCGQSLLQKPVPPSPIGEMNCPKCGTPNRSDAKFCRACGNRLARNAVPIPQRFRMAETPIMLPPATVMAETPDRKISSTGELKLKVLWMGGFTQEFKLTKPTITLGRAAGNDIILNHPAVSSQHLHLGLADGTLEVTDLDSTNGTMVNGRRLPARVPQKTYLGDEIRIGDLNGNWVKLTFQKEGFEVIRQPSRGQLDLPNLKDILIGRNPLSSVLLNHPSVSFRHAVITSRDGEAVIRDLGSRNGTYLNGRRITQAPLKSGDQIQIGPFQLTYDPQSRRLAHSMRSGHRIDIIHLGRKIGKNKYILYDIDMSIYPGEFVALVGGSGAGKSTLLKAMNGYEHATHGNILLDGESFYEKLDLYRPQMGYVPQDDIIHQVLPVRLALKYAARLRLPDARPKEIEARIKEALLAVDLVEHANKPVRILSGGQRKRVSIAAELLARPTLFFLDEPTTGLDPGLEKKLMYDLNRLTDEGRTVVLVTHATANIEQCDQIAFLSYGRLSYYGPPNEALQFYNVRDFSDIYLKLSQEVEPAKGKPATQPLQPFYQRRFPRGGKTMAGILWADRFKLSPFYRKYVQERLVRLKAERGLIRRKIPRRGPRDSFLRQTIILARRQFDLVRFDFRTLAILLIIMPVIGILFGGVSDPYTFKGEVTYKSPEVNTFDEIKAHFTAELQGKEPGSKDAEIKYVPLENARMLVIMISLALTQAGTFSAAYEIVKERPIFRRERAVNLKVLAYVLSKALVLGIFALFQVSSMLLALGLFGVDLNVPGIFFANSALLELFITLYLGVLASISFGLLISAVVPSTDVVLYAILIQLFAQIILSGAMFPIGNTAIPKMTIAYWTTVGVGSTIDLPALNNLGMFCQVVEVPNLQTGGKEHQVQCSPSKVVLQPGGASEKKDGDYQHTASRLIFTWIGTLVHAAFYFVLTIVIVARQRFV
jgi:ABC-type multidrug transport system ATPase subunit/pSer/pThr/pTyr-binding forkhead associated (FHA) protein